MFDTLYRPVNDAVDKVVVEEAGPSHGQVIRSPSLEITVVEVDQEENPFLSAVGRQRAMTFLSDDDKKARKSGTFVEMSGLVYKTFDPKVHVIAPFIPPMAWDWYMSLDHGWNNPTAVLWHAVAPNGDIYTFSEHYKSEMTIQQHVDVITMREQLWGKEPELRTGDPAMKQTSGITGTSILEEYAARGIYLSVEGVPRDVGIGIARIQQYLRLNPVTKKPKWYITEDCVNLITEMRRLRWKKYASKKMQMEHNKTEQIHKKDDHACDSARYFFTLMPDLGGNEFIGEQGPYIEPAKVDTDYGLALLRSINEGLPDPDSEGWSISEGVDLADLSQ